MSARAQELELELISKRREVIDLTAELDRAKRKINDLELDCKNAEIDVRRLQQSVEAWQEKADYLEEDLAIKQIKQWYLKPLFLFAAGFTSATVLILFLIRGYHV